MEKYYGIPNNIWKKLTKEQQDQASWDCSYWIKEPCPKCGGLRFKRVNSGNNSDGDEMYYDKKEERWRLIYDDWMCKDCGKYLEADTRTGMFKRNYWQKKFPKLFKI